MAKVLVLFYSTYGHVYKMAQAIADGAGSVDGVTVDTKRVEELMPPETLKAIGADKAQAAFADVPVASADDLLDYDAIIVGTPTRFGSAAAQMRNFWDRTGKLWAEGKLIGKLGSVFCATGTQHGGQETTIASMFSTFLHHGMLIAGLPYSEKRIMEMGEITGGGPNGAATMSNTDGSRMPSENELAIARSQGAHIAGLAKKLAD